MPVCRLSYSYFTASSSRASYLNDKSSQKSFPSFPLPRWWFSLRPLDRVSKKTTVERNINQIDRNERWSSCLEFEALCIRMEKRGTLLTIDTHFRGFCLGYPNISYPGQHSIQAGTSKYSWYDHLEKSIILFCRWKRWSFTLKFLSEIFGLRNTGLQQ